MQQALIDLLGKPFATIAKETVPDPLAMTDSTYEQPLPAAQLLSASSAHDSNCDKILAIIEVTEHWPAAL